MFDDVFILYHSRVDRIILVANAKILYFLCIMLTWYEMPEYLAGNIGCLGLVLIMNLSFIHFAHEGLRE